MRIELSKGALFTLAIFFICTCSLLAQDEGVIKTAPEEILQEAESTGTAPLDGEAQPEGPAESSDSATTTSETQLSGIDTASDRVTMDFKDADIHNVLRILSMKGGVNIVAGKGVEGPVSIRLTNVPWRQALEVILKTYGYGYEDRDNIIRVMPVGEFTELERMRRELEAQQDLMTEVVTLKYLDANDAKKTLEPLLTPNRGTITVLKVSGQKGWKFKTEEGGLAKKVRETTEAKSKTLVISDIQSKLDRIRAIIEKMDVKPKQVVIETRIMEVNRDVLKDIGIDWGTGSGGARTSTITGVGVDRSGRKGDRAQVGGNVLGSEVAPSIFGPKATSISGVDPYNAGLNLLYSKLTGAQFEVLLHALEEDVDTNTLSAPRIVTLENQEATILVGTKMAITKATVDEETGAVIGGELDYYENVGIQLNVIPQISGDGTINMIIHPSVSSISDYVSIYNSAGYQIAKYPNINIREAETQVLMNDGETVIIGGLLKDVQSRGKYKVPILGDIPILGLLFQRDTTDIAKIDLLIFITAKTIKHSEEMEIRYTKPVVEIGSEALRAHELLVNPPKAKNNK